MSTASALCYAHENQTKRLVGAGKMASFADSGCRVERTVFLKDRPSFATSGYNPLWHQSVNLGEQAGPVTDDLSYFYMSFSVCDLLSQCSIPRHYYPPDSAAASAPLPCTQRCTSALGLHALGGSSGGTARSARTMRSLGHLA